MTCFALAPFQPTLTLRRSAYSWPTDAQIAIDSCKYLRGGHLTILRGAVKLNLTLIVPGERKLIRAGVEQRATHIVSFCQQRIGLDLDSLIDLVGNELAAILWPAGSAVAATDTSVSTGVVIPTICLTVFAASAGLTVLSLDPTV